MAFRRILIVAVLAVAGACSGSNSVIPTPPTTPSPTPTGTGPTVNVSIPSGARVLTTTAFGTNPLTVAVGTTVIWTNNDSTGHDTAANGGLWGSPVLSPGQSFQFKFTTTGTFPYRCTIHPNMVGTVTVQ
jgi:plastocyanin